MTDELPKKYLKFEELFALFKENPERLTPKPAFIYRNISLYKTCFACPEQYDAKIENGEQVGYLRLRHGEFTVAVPDDDGKIIYTASPNGDGMFEHDEREKYLMAAIDAILAA